MSKTLIQDESIAWTDLGGGIQRKIMAHNDEMMIVKVAFATGGIGAMHSHPHTQASYIESGVFKLTIGDETSILKAGDAYFVPSEVEHGAECLETGVLVDVFSPVRKDFLS